MRLEGNLYILPEWKSKYKNEVFQKPQKPRQDYAKDILRRIPEKEMKKSELIDLLIKEFSFTRTIAFATLSRKKYFVNYKKTNGETWTKEKLIINNKSNNADKIKLERTLTDLLQNKDDKSMKLSEVVKYLMLNSNYKKQTIYKILNNLDVDNKIKKFYKDGKKWLRLKSRPLPVTRIVNPQWTDIQIELGHDLKDYFNDSDQPNYSIDLNEAMALFKKVVDYTTNEKGLDGLNEQLLPSLFKFFKHSNDKGDLLNHQKQILTSLDPFLKKILFIVNITEYNRTIVR